MKTRKKTYSEMTTAELCDATSEFDNEIKRFPPGRALTAAQARMIARSRQRGRPKVGEGAANVQITIERSLLRRADRFAMSLGLTRSQLIAQGLNRWMKKAG